MREGAQYAGAVTLILLTGFLFIFCGITGRFAVLLGDIVTPHDMLVSQ